MRQILACCLAVAALSSCGLFRVRPPEYPIRELGDGLNAQDLIVPDDGRVARPGDVVTVDYWIWLVEDGELVDSSGERGQPFTFRLEPGAVFPGLERGVVGMRELGSRRLYVPAALGYGPEGLPPRIPGGADLRVEVELLSLERADEASAP